MVYILEIDSLVFLKFIHRLLNVQCTECDVFTKSEDTMLKISLIYLFHIYFYIIC